MKIQILNFTHEIIAVLKCLKIIFQDLLTSKKSTEFFYTLFFTSKWWKYQLDVCIKLKEGNGWKTNYINNNLE